MSFKAFNLEDKMVNCLSKLGYNEPSPVQTAVIPKALKGQNILAQSETGSGKTHSYLIPLVSKTDVNLQRVQSIVICPSRELARQSYEFAREFIRFYPKLKVRLFTSEADVSDNEEGANVAPHIVFGTPGRLKAILCDSSLFNLQSVKSIVLDEADMLLDLGYFEDIEKVFSRLKSPQIMVFSATLRQNLKDELRKLTPNDFEYSAENVRTASKVSHHMVDIKHIGQSEALARFLKIRNPYLCLAFASKKETVGAVHADLKERGIDAIYFSGSLDERSRKKAIREIKSNKHSLIVCSDLLARGIDIEDVSDVVSLDLPSESEFYYHRAGRSGRFGKTGDSWVFYNSDSVNEAKALMDEGVKFDFFILKENGLVPDPVGLLPKKKLSKKSELPEEERREILIAKARTKKKKVEPMHKKKQQFAIEKVKRKYKRKAIQKSIRKGMSKNNNG